MSKVDKVAGNSIVGRRSNGSLIVHYDGFDKSLTQQCFSEAADINVLMRKWLNGVPPPGSDAARQVFKDVSMVGTYQQSLDTVMAVQESFDELPADTRARFKNDPSELLDFVHDYRNHDECVKLGLIDGDVSTIVESVPTTGDQPSEQLPT